MAVGVGKTVVVGSSDNYRFTHCPATKSFTE